MRDFAQRQNSLRSIWLVSQFELIRLFFTKRGIILFLSFALVWLFILKNVVLESVKVLNNPSFIDQIAAWSGRLNLDYLLQWPYSELAVYWVLGVFIFPFMTVLITSDQTASDASRGTIRFLLLRTSRNQLLVGRFLGQSIIMASFIVLTITPALIMGMLREPHGLLVTIPQLLLVASNLLLICLPLIALMALFNAMLQSSKLSVTSTFILLPVLFNIISYLASYITPLTYLSYLFPIVQLTDVLQMESLKTSAIIIPISQTFIYLGLAQFVLARKAL